MSLIKSKILSRIFLLSFITLFMFTKNYGLEVSHMIPVTHETELISNIMCQVLNKNQLYDDKFSIFSLEINNNKLDGYELLLSSQNGGKLQPSSTLHGETELAYQLNVITEYGQLGNNMNINQMITPTVDDYDYVVISPDFNSYQSSATKSLSLRFEIEFSSDTYDSSLAGDLTDSITVKYIDL